MAISSPVSASTGRSIKALSKTGKSVDEIAALVRESESAVAQCLFSTGIGKRIGRDANAQVAHLKRKGVHPTVIAAMLNNPADKEEPAPKAPATASLFNVTVGRADELISSIVASATATEPAQPATPAHASDAVDDQKTGRYRRIIELMADGLSLRQIMDELGCGIMDIKAAQQASDCGELDGQKSAGTSGDSAPAPAPKTGSEPEGKTAPKPKPEAVPRPDVKVPTGSAQKPGPTALPGASTDTPAPAKPAAPVAPTLGSAAKPGPASGRVRPQATDLARQGLTVHEITERLGAKSDTVAALFEQIGYRYRGRKAHDAVRDLSAHGYHPSVIALALNVKIVDVQRYVLSAASGYAPSGATTGPQLPDAKSLEGMVMRLMAAGRNNKAIMDSLQLEYQTLITIRRKFDSKFGMYYSGEQVVGPTPRPTPPEPATKVEPTTTTRPADVPDLTSTPVVETPDRRLSPVTAELLRLADLNLTLPEITQRMKLSTKQVTSLAAREKRFIPDSRQVRDDLNRIAKHSDSGKTLTEILDFEKLNIYQMRAQMRQSIVGSGIGHEAFRKLLDDEADAKRRALHAAGSPGAADGTSEMDKMRDEFDQLIAQSVTLAKQGHTLNQIAEQSGMKSERLKLKLRLAVMEKHTDSAVIRKLLEGKKAAPVPTAEEHPSPVVPQPLDPEADLLGEVARLGRGKTTLWQIATRLSVRHNELKGRLQRAVEASHEESEVFKELLERGSYTNKPGQAAARQTGYKSLYEAPRSGTRATTTAQQPITKEVLLEIARLAKTGQTREQILHALKINSVGMAVTMNTAAHNGHPDAEVFRQLGERGVYTVPDSAETGTAEGITAPAGQSGRHQVPEPALKRPAAASDVLAQAAELAREGLTIKMIAEQTGVNVVDLRDKLERALTKSHPDVEVFRQLRVYGAYSPWAVREVSKKNEEETSRSGFLDTIVGMVKEGLMPADVARRLQLFQGQLTAILSAVEARGAYPELAYLTQWRTGRKMTRTPVPAAPFSDEGLLREVVRMAKDGKRWVQIINALPNVGLLATLTKAIEAGHPDSDVLEQLKSSGAYTAPEPTPVIQESPANPAGSEAFAAGDTVIISITDPSRTDVIMLDEVEAEVITVLEGMAVVKLLDGHRKGDTVPLRLTDLVKPDDDDVEPKMYQPGDNIQFGRHGVLRSGTVKTPPLHLSGETQYAVTLSTGEDALVRLADIKS